MERDTEITAVALAVAVSAYALGRQHGADKWQARFDRADWAIIKTDKRSYNL